MVRIEIFKGKAIKPYIRKLAEMRVQEFSHFPYLYVATVEEDAEYSQGYASEENALFCIAFDNKDVIGLYSGAPFNSNISFLQDWKKRIFQDGLDLNDSYYSGELILEKEWRKRGVGTQLMNRFLKEVKGMNYKSVAGVTVNRSQDHTLRPKNYQDTDDIWPKYGLQRTNITLPVEYPTRQGDGSVRNEKNILSLWVKSL